MSKSRLIQVSSIFTLVAGFAMSPGQARADAPICQSGGPNAASCSISGNGGCSVSCRVGSYACCNPYECICIVGGPQN